MLLDLIDIVPYGDFENVFPLSLICILFVFIAIIVGLFSLYTERFMPRAKRYAIIGIVLGTGSGIFLIVEFFMTVTSLN